MSEMIKVYNCSRQVIALQARHPGADFYTEQQIRIAPSKQVSLLKSHINQSQIENLQSKRLIRVVYDSEI